MEQIYIKHVTYFCVTYFLSCNISVIFVGETQESLSYSFCLGQSTISGIVKDTCCALISILQEKYLKFPIN